MSDSLSSVRRALRSIRSAERRALRHKMDRYNVLAQKSRSDMPDYNTDSAKTTNDVIQETLAIAKHESTKRAGGRLSSDSRLFQDASIVQPEVRSTWQQKIGMYRVLDADAKQKLIDQSGGLRSLTLLRESRLNDLSKWLVYMWCEGEGYDPEKHPKSV